MNDFLTHIAGIFDKDILFASVLPGLLFLVSISGVFCFVIGLNPLIELYLNFPVDLRVVFGGVVFIGLIVFSYVLYAFRESFLKFWSGHSSPLSMFRSPREARFRVLREKSNYSVWLPLYNDFRRAIHYDSVPRHSLPLDVENKLIKEIEKLKFESSEEEIDKFVGHVRKELAEYANTSFDRVFRSLSTTVTSWLPTPTAMVAGKLREAYGHFIEKKMLTTNTSLKDIDDQAKCKLLYQIWMVRNKAEGYDIDQLFSSLGMACQSFTPSSMHGIFHQLLDAIFELDRESQHYLKHALWWSKLQELLMLSNKADIEMTEELRKEWIENGEEEELNRIKNFDRNSGMKQTQELLRHIQKLFETVERSMLSRVLRALQDLNEKFQSENQELAIELDTQFGSLGSIAGTRLGNIIQAYNEYSYKRYKMAAEIFWPRLQKVIGDDYGKLISDHKTKLDFAVTGISLASIFLGLCLVGPFFYPSVQF
jgi:hypothetical protein